MSAMGYDSFNKANDMTDTNLTHTVTYHTPLIHTPQQFTTVRITRAQRDAINAERAAACGCIANPSTAENLFIEMFGPEFA